MPSSSLERLVNDVHSWAKSFGADDGENCILCKNLIDLSFQEGGAYFGFVRPEEGQTGQFSDFSYVIFPAKGEGACLVVLGVGTLGFKNDYELAATPGLRRSFLRLISENGYCKTSLLDIETSLSREFMRMLDEKAPHLKKTIKMYEKVLPVCELIDDPGSEQGQNILKAFLASYAKVRGWPGNKSEREAVKKALHAIPLPVQQDQEAEVNRLLETRHFIVLQGAPGTGKTYLAKVLAEKANAKTFFIQFQAETAYSDFVYGIRPTLNTGELSFSPYEGVLFRAIKYAKDLEEQKQTDKKVYLIIDEINRANLANVLGPVFYLFEYQMGKSSVEMDIGGGLKLSTLPNNFFVIGTMNTADRSLAVVDFALRRRFAWYTLLPKPINNLPEGQQFFTDDFNEFRDLFEWYATDEEMNLQPGQGYFIARDEMEMKDRIRYELMPLIKEYFAEGLLLKARDAFSNYFYNRIGEVMYR